MKKKGRWKWTLIIDGSVISRSKATSYQGLLKVLENVAQKEVFVLVALQENIA